MVLKFGLCSYEVLYYIISPTNCRSRVLVVGVMRSQMRRLPARLLPCMVSCVMAFKAPISAPSACVEAGCRSLRLDRGRAQEKRAKRGASLKSCALEGWPEEVSYTHTPNMSDVSRHDMRLLRQDYLPGVAIRRVTDHAHPAYGQSALYATAGFRLGDVLGQYTGKGDAQTLGRRVRDAPVGHGPEFRLLHAGRGCGDDGNELRMINDFRGVPGATGPNCRFSRAAIRGFRAALIVAIKPIAPNEELTKALACVEWVCLRLPKRRVYQDLRFTAFVLNPTEWGSTSAPPPSGSLVVYSF